MRPQRTFFRAAILAAACLFALAPAALAGGPVCGTPDIPDGDPAGPTSGGVPLSPYFPLVGASSITVAWGEGTNPAPPGTIYAVKLFSRVGSPPFFNNPPCSFAPGEDATGLISSGTTTGLNMKFTGLLGETSYYVYVRATDGIGGESSPLYSSVFTLAGGPSYTYSTTHSTGVWTNTRTITLRGAGAPHYEWIFFDDQPATYITPGTGQFWDGQRLTLSLVSDGTSYFHALARDSQNNTPFPQDDLGPFLLDTTQPTIAAVVAQSSATDSTPFASGTPSSASNPRFTWAAPASLSPIVGYSYAIGPGNPAPGNVVITTDTFVDFLPPAFGSYTVNVKALDSAGNWGPVATFFFIYVKATPTASAFTPRGNVFNPKLGQSMTLNYALAQSGRVKAVLLTMQGEPVKTLVDADLPVGNYSTPWRGDNDGGRTVATGIYLLVIEAPGYRKTLKVAVIK